ncbi:MAG: cell division protein SepF [Fimbriimonas ginsengisoli]|uniref:Cell division protein SepF n=1 Tax=Fimbriimonas ginsengisoli TaxID=1005039 RepID=A0A931M201_FIMGI|nr:cell division protein SepF [Fimbriimonas ginsengisoli]MBI3721011.1 cell division protein SepF [Fimbriimonas ginsengisoli]
MEELELQDKPGLFGRIAGIFSREDDEDVDDTRKGKNLTLRTAHRYTITVRRQVVSFDDAMAAADGLKQGEQQILNLSGTDAQLRQKIVDFMCGVNFAQEGTWEEVGEHVYLIVPACAYVEVAPATPRMGAIRN